MFSTLLYHLYASKPYQVRRAIERIVAKVEGGEYYSQTLRKIYKDYHDICVGLYSYGCFNFKCVPSGTQIGRYCSFANFRIFSRNHPLNFISMHPFFYNSHLGYVQEDQVPHTRLQIGHGVWIGYNAIITPRVSKIGNGAVIGAGSVVTKDVPAYAVVAGNPGRVIKYRFSEEVTEQVEALGWWDEDMEILSKKLKLFTSPVASKDDLDRLRDIEI